MKTVTSVAAMRALSLQWRHQGKPVAFVPTMGALHEGHLSLVRRARALAGPDGVVVVSIYVNPLQFGPREDFARYPRSFPRDSKLCRRERVDLLFAPSASQMYPATTSASHTTYVVEAELSQPMEGVSRSTHFRGVTTVVAKLFNLVQPSLAVFGAKDYQQAVVVQRMVRNLSFPIRIVVAPTVREADGLAISSRNQYLSPEERRQAPVLHQCLQEARRRVRAAKRPLTASQLKRALRRQITACPAARVDYIEFFDPRTLRPVAEVRRGTHLALAVYIGKTRLIDNARLG